VIPDACALASDRFHKALVLSRSDPDEHVQKIVSCTKGIIFMGTPHSGVDGLVRWARMLASSLGLFTQVNADILDVLQRKSTILFRIQEDFYTMIRDKQRRNEAEIEITCFFEELPTSNVGMVSSGANERTYSTGWIPNHQLGCPTGLRLFAGVQQHRHSLRPPRDDQIERWHGGRGSSDQCNCCCPGPVVAKMSTLAHSYSREVRNREYYDTSHV
jgi:hypothetical protein